MSMLNRRQLLGGMASAAVLAPLPPLALNWQLGSASLAAFGERAIHQQQVFVDYSGLAERYTPPVGIHSTQAYRASLSETEFLRRHWFK